ncbi:MAG TPA: fibronectin type III domain-containing protein, partial [Pyrinomonadaceae bacterium]
MPASREGLRATAMFCLIATVLAAAVLATASAQSGGFSPQSPAKEYIYVGGRLVATEEPSAMSPAAPTNAGAAGPSGLSWTDNSNNETGFKIESCKLVNSACTQWQQIATVGANVVKYREGDLLGCEYKYRVRATNGVGDSAYSNEARPKPPCLIEGGGSLSEEAVIWANVSGATASGNNLSKSIPSYAWDAGAVSTRAIASGDGYVQITPDHTGTYRMFGLSKGDSDQNYTDIDYCLGLGEGILVVYEAGVSRGYVGTYAAGDKLAVVVEAGGVKYYRNDTLLYTSTVSLSPASYPLRLDTSLSTSYSTLTDAKIAAVSFGGLQPPEAVTWKNVTSTVQAVGNTLRKVSGTNTWYDAGASSIKGIDPGDGYMEFTPGEASTWRMVGLGNGDTSVHYADIEYAFYMVGGGGLHIY